MPTEPKPAPDLLSPEEVQEIRDRTLRAIAPLKPAEKSQKYAVGDKRTKAGQELPQYYLVYFLLVDLLGFPHGGQWEKVAWTIAVDLDGHLALIEHRKMGLGIFSPATTEDEEIARRIVVLIKKGIKEAAPFFDDLAARAVQSSKLNVKNISSWLFQRYEYFRDQFMAKAAEAEARKKEVTVTPLESFSGGTGRSYSFPSFELRRKAGWLGVAAIEAFFGWTEHVLIHVAILQGKITTGDDVARLAAADWSEKIKTALDLTDPTTKALFDELLNIRRQIRNYMAHGAFGKEGEAFEFHSAAGAVPVMLTDRNGSDRFSLFGGPPSFDEGAAIETCEKFVDHLWSGALAPAKIYIQDAEFPIVLTFAKDGTYKHAMESEEEMEQFVEYWGREMDNAANMDW
jgi:hypothetical protein